MQVYLTRKLNALYPAYGSDLEYIRSLPLGEIFRGKITRPRNIGHHRKLFALLSLVLDNLPEHLEDHFKNVDDLLYEMKLQTGHREKYITMSGREVWRVKSISFEKMPQDEFQLFYDGCIKVICKHILPGVTREELINQISQF